MLDKRIKLMNNILKVTILLWILLLVPINTVAKDNVNIQYVINSLIAVILMILVLCAVFKKLYKSIDNTPETIRKADRYCKISSIGAILVTCILFVFISSMSIFTKMTITVCYGIAIAILGNRLGKSLQDSR